MPKRGKKYQEARKLFDRQELYDADAALDLVVKAAPAKFDETVEVHIKLGVDGRHADQQVRGAIVLPNGTGKTKRVCVIAEGPKAEEARNAGADVVGGQEILDEIAKGWLEFDVMIATPDQMPKLGRLGRILGPKGLMPNPKTGTVTMDVAKAVNESKGGKVNYRTDKDGNVHLPIGRVSFDSAKLVENYEAIHALLLRIRPSVVKGTYVKNCVVSSTMGPAVKVAA